MREVWFETIGSTNLEARRRIDTGEPGPLWLRAGEQTSGKGRLGREWVSKPGNLYCSLIWPTQAPLQAMSQIGFVACLSVYDAAAAYVNPGDITLKWPNDCLLNGAKFCGILAEAVGPGLCIIGIGINIAHAPAGLPYKANRLAAANSDDVFTRLKAALASNLETWNDGKGFHTIRDKWLSKCAHVGHAVSVDGRQGRFSGLGADGALLHEVNGHITAVYAGDVRVEYQSQP